MKNILIGFCLFASPFFANAQYATIGKIHRLDPELDAIIDTTAQIEVIAQGFVWAEGPLSISNKKKASRTVSVGDTFLFCGFEKIFYLCINKH